MANAGDEDPKRSRAVAPAATKPGLTGVGTTLAAPTFPSLLSSAFHVVEQRWQCQTSADGVLLGWSSSDSLRCRISRRRR